jgi:hypothetical protein
VVRVDENDVPALVAGKVLSRLEQLPADALALELRKDIEPSTLATRITWRS